MPTSRPPRNGMRNAEKNSGVTYRMLAVRSSLSGCGRPTIATGQMPPPQAIGATVV